MYPPSSPPRDLEIMLGESLAHHIESNLDNVENNKPQALTSHNAGANLSKTRQTLLKKGGRKVRSSSSSGLQRPQHHQCQQPHQKVLLRNNPTRLADINNNNVSVSVKSQAQFNAELANGRTQSTVLTLHHKQGTKKELLKSKGGRVERCTNQSGSQPVHSLIKHDQPVPNLNTRSHRAKHSHASAATQSTKKPDNINQKKAVSPFQQHLRDAKPFNSPDNIKVVSAVSALLASEEELRDGEKIYAGAKFSEPPSPSVLPKPPSHWVGKSGAQHPDPSREQMTVHLKSLLKVQD